MDYFIEYTLPLWYLLYKFEGKLIYWEPNIPGTVSVKYKTTNVCLRGHTGVVGGEQRSDGKYKYWWHTIAQYVT